MVKTVKMIEFGIKPVFEKSVLAKTDAKPIPTIFSRAMALQPSTYW
jgi:hypothetical protein